LYQVFSFDLTIAVLLILTRLLGWPMLRS
jgi:hypothetical protein